MRYTRPVPTGTPCGLLVQTRWRPSRHQGQGVRVPQMVQSYYIHPIRPMGWRFRRRAHRMSPRAWYRRQLSPPQLKITRQGFSPPLMDLNPIAKTPATYPACGKQARVLIISFLRVRAWTWRACAHDYRPKAWSLNKRQVQGTPHSNRQACVPRTCCNINQDQGRAPRKGSWLNVAATPSPHSETSTPQLHFTPPSPILRQRQ